jgi:hypothetical protein
VDSQVDGVSFAAPASGRRTHGMEQNLHFGGEPEKPANQNKQIYPIKRNKINKLNELKEHTEPVLKPEDVKKMTGTKQAYKRNQNFVIRQIENGTVLVPIKNNVGDMNRIYNLNEVGAFIWQNIKCKHSITDLKKMILSEFEVTESQAEADLNEFVKDLAEIEAIVAASGCPDCQCS